MYKSESVSFFMGANTANGFYSLFDGLYCAEDGWKAYVIKGGPGTGKSTLMKRIANEADRRGMFCERIYCSSDPDSLDAVIIPGLKIAVADGTPPHTIEPMYPGACERTVELGTFRDDAKLAENACEVIEKAKLNSEEHKKCVGFLKAAKNAERDMNELICPAVQIDKLHCLALKLAESMLGVVSGSRGTEKLRFLSALTPKGEVIFEDSFDVLCEKRIVLADDLGAAGSAFMKIMKNIILERGYDCICCLCPIAPDRIEHIIIPELSLGFFLSNRFHPYSKTPDKTIDCAKFYNSQTLKSHKNRISFDRRAMDELLAEAVSRLECAKAIHDELEQYYIAVMDRDALTKASERLIGEIFGNE